MKNITKIGKTKSKTYLKNKKGEIKKGGRKKEGKKEERIERRWEEDTIISIYAYLSNENSYLFFSKKIVAIEQILHSVSTTQCQSVQ